MPGIGHQWLWGFRDFITPQSGRGISSAPRLGRLDTLVAKFIFDLPLKSFFKNGAVRFEFKPKAKISVAPPNPFHTRFEAIDSIAWLLIVFCFDFVSLGGVSEAIFGSSEAQWCGTARRASGIAPLRRMALLIVEIKKTKKAKSVAG